MIFVKLHLSIWRVEDERGECITEFLLAIGKVSIDLVECLKGCFRLVVIIHGAQGRAGEAIFGVIALMTRDVVAKMVETNQKPGVVVNMSSVARHGNAFGLIDGRVVCGAFALRPRTRDRR